MRKKRSFFQWAAWRNPSPSGEGHAGCLSGCDKELATPYQSKEPPLFKGGVLQTKASNQTRLTSFGLNLLYFLFFIPILESKPLALYLTWYTDPTSTIAIHWHTPLDSPESTLTLHGFEPFEGTYTQLGSRLVHTLLLESLEPDTEYTFQIESDPTLYKFRTAPKTIQAPLRFVVGGDAYHTTNLFQSMNQTIVKKEPLFAVIGGDIAYAISGNPFRLRSASHNRWFSFFEHWQQQMTLPDGRLIPLVVVIGNHDINPDTVGLFFHLFPFPERRLYRTLDFGNYLSLILLDTGHFHPIEGEQTDWLETALAANINIRYRFPIYHIGAYPSYYSYSGPIPHKIRTHWCPLFEKHGIRYAFENHSHTWKKTHPLRNGEIDPTGVTYLGDGCWGAPPRPASPRWYLEKQGQKNNVYILEISPDNTTIEAVGINGEILDSFKYAP